MTITESEFWVAIQGTMITDPAKLFTSPVGARVMELIRVLHDLNDGMGTIRYEVTIGDVIEHFGHKLEEIGMQPVKQSKVYGLLRVMASLDLVQQQIINTVVVYKETPVASLFKDKIAGCYVLDVDGNPVMPHVLQDDGRRIFLEGGEKTLKTYTLTKKGRILLDLYLKHVNGGNQT